MAKYCMQCGKENGDDAVFCIGCGQRFPEVSPPQAPSPPQSGWAPPQPQQPLLYTAETGPGVHQHMFTDVFLKDSAGSVILVARKPSLIHQNYNIVDANGNAVGFIESKTHLTHRSMVVEDVNHTPQGVVQLSNVSENRLPPSCWLEDANGSRTASLMYTGGRMAFVAVKPDGSNAFDATMAFGQSVTQELAALQHRAYTISLIDREFPLPMLVALIATVDQA